MKPNVQEAIEDLEKLKDTLYLAEEYLTISNIIAKLQGYELPPEVLQKYICSVCGATDVKLWRRSHDSNVEPTCATCSTKGTRIGPVDEWGQVQSCVDSRIKTDQLYDPSLGLPSLVPYVPDKDGSTWGYTSIPQAGVFWWRQLSTYSKRSD